jgi:all-trans-retinol dehydrogenase (NAD+)
MKTIRDQVILITGGASGIGKLMALSFAELGAKVAVWDVSEANLRSLEEEATARGLAVLAAKCDVSDREEVYRLAEKLVAVLGPVDVLVNNAGIVSGTNFLDTDDEQLLRTMRINVASNFWTVKAFLPSMLERNSGHLVTIASAAGLIGVKGLADYSASKFAAFGFHEALRMELRRMKSSIAATVVCPFFIDTGMFEGVRTRFPFLLPIMKSEKAARRIVKAIVRKKKRLIMPPFVYSVYLLRLFPVGFFDAMADFFGVNTSMEEFKGRA